MNISPVYNKSTQAFGKRIPISMFNVINTDTKQKVPTVLYELDCSDKEDLEEIRNCPNTHYFNDKICIFMQNKFLYKTITSKLDKNTMDFDLLSSFDKDKQTRKFYIVETVDREQIGICQTNDNEDGSKSIEFIETNQDNVFKYAGQGIIASIEKILLKNDSDRLIIDNPAKQAEDFYTKKCGFQPLDDMNFVIHKKEMNDFVSKFEAKTHRPIIDLTA